MNIFTFDIEEWAIAKARGVMDTAVYAEYDRFLDTILQVLDERGFKGTFFCTGRMAMWFPEVVRLIESRGHEIGCHSNVHTWLNKMTLQECREDTHAAVDALEQCIGRKVLSYRAPAFSLGEENKWAFEILAENGIERDASVFPAVRDFGGFARFGQQIPCIVEYSGVRMKEFPIPMASVPGRRVAYSGGGYFRLFPLWFIRQQIKGRRSCAPHLPVRGESITSIFNTAQKIAYSGGEISDTPYVMTYFHIFDLLPERNGVMSREAYEAYFKEPGTLKARYIRHFKENIGRNAAIGKLLKLISTEEFVNIEQACENIDWKAVPVVLLSNY